MKGPLAPRGIFSVPVKRSFTYRRYDIHNSKGPDPKDLTKTRGVMQEIHRHTAHPTGDTKRFVVTAIRAARSHE